MAGFFSVKNFDLYQHYKDRDPPWIKLHYRILSDYGFGILPDEAKAHLLAIGLLASRCANRVPNDPVWVGNHINATGPVDLAALIAAGWLILDSVTAPINGKREVWPSRYITPAIKKAVHERDGGKCQTCGSTERIEYDHKIPVSKGGCSVEENLQLLCAPCNRAKRSKLLRSFSPPRSVETETQVQTETDKETTSLRSVSKKARTQIGDWLPMIAQQQSAAAFWGTKDRIDIDVAEQMDQFRDHHLKTGATMADWPAAWRTWYRNAPKMNRKPDNGRDRKPTSTDRHLAGIASIVDDIRAGRTGGRQTGA